MKNDMRAGREVIMVVVEVEAARAALQVGAGMLTFASSLVFTRSFALFLRGHIMYLTLVL
jgi:hypothetical protein